MEQTVQSLKIIFLKVYFFYSPEVEIEQFDRFISHSKIIYFIVCNAAYEKNHL